jgi:hypothetical protein
MKLLFAMTLWLWAACPGWTVTTLEQSYTCPIDGEKWTQRIETSTRPTGLRLDLKKLGDVVEPPTLPQCPKCGFIQFSDQLSEPVLKKLKAFIPSPDYQILAAKSPSWACLAQIQEFLDGAGLSRNPKTAPMQVGFSYLRAAWQVEDKPAQRDRFLGRAHERFLKVAQTMQPGDKDRLNVLLLCGELERRLGKFEAAEKRFRELLDAEEFKGEARREPIVNLQLQLIADRDSTPHALGGGKEMPVIPLGIGAAPPAISGAEPGGGTPAGSGALDFSKPMLLEGTGPSAPFPPR